MASIEQQIPTGKGIGAPGASLGISSVGYGTFQPKAKFLWVVEINCPASIGIKGSGSGANSAAGDRVFSLTVYKAARPKFEFEEITVTHLNEFATFPGKIKKPEPIALEFNDGMVYQSGSNITSAYDCALALHQWKTKIYDATYGTGDYAQNIKGWLTLSLLNPALYSVEAWTGLGTFPLTIDMGDVSYEDGAAKCTVNATFNIDKWYYGDQRGKVLSNDGPQ